MNEAIKHHLQKEIKEQTKLPGGFTFQTWLLTLSDNQKVVFRTQKDFKTGGGRDIIISEVLEREKFFYDNVNKSLGHICPEVYVVDGTRQHFDMSFCIMEYFEGTPLNACFKDFDPQAQDNISRKIGEISAQINNIEIDSNHPYVKNRPPWEEFIAQSLQEKLQPLITSNVISQDEANTITNNMRKKKASKTNSFLHLDIRHVNIIHNNGQLFMLDAENCEFGDPLFELAVIDIAGELTPPLIEAYKRKNDIDLNNELYNFYCLERQALVLHLFMNIIKSDTESTKLYLSRFNKLKKATLG